MLNDGACNTKSKLLLLMDFLVRAQEAALSLHAEVIDISILDEFVFIYIPDNNK